MKHTGIMIIGPSGGGKTTLRKRRIPESSGAKGMEEWIKNDSI